MIFLCEIFDATASSFLIKASTKCAKRMLARFVLLHVHTIQLMHAYIICVHGVFDPKIVAIASSNHAKL